MKKLVFAITLIINSLLASLSNTNAQSPTITSGFYPKIGQGYTMYLDTNRTHSPIPQGGASQTWDYSNLTAFDTFNYQFVAPSGTPFGSMFSNAAEAIVLIKNYSNSMDDWSHYSYINSQYATLGSVEISTQGDTFIDNYSETQSQLSFPITYGWAYNDSFYFKDGFFSKGKTLYNGDTPYGRDHNAAIGYGTLKMPNATYDVLLVRDSFATADSGSSSAIYSVFYNFISPNYLDIILGVTENIEPKNGNKYSSSYQLNPIITTGISEQKSIGVSSLIYPNPSKGNTILRVNSPGATKTLLSVTDEMGRRVMPDENINLLAGANEIPIASENLCTGIYFVSLLGDGFTSREKFIKQ